jgi:1,4-alpha-glucan branching enzyme
VREFLIGERALLAEAVSHRRTARGCRRLHALSRLLAQEGEWIPNRYGGRENLEAIEFLRRFNELAHRCPAPSPSPKNRRRSRRLAAGLCQRPRLHHEVEHGLDARHAALLREDPVHRKYHHNNITFSMLYAFTENFVLPISHDEVVYGKRLAALENAGRRVAEVRQRARVPGLHVRASRQEAAVHGCDIGDYNEWITTPACPGIVLQFHACGPAVVRARTEPALSREPALYQVDFDTPASSGSISRMWRSRHLVPAAALRNRSDDIVFACNFTPVPRTVIPIGVPEAGFYQEILNTDAAMFGGSNWATPEA